MLKKFLIATLIIFMSTGKAEAVDMFGITDIISRIAVTNVNGEVVKTFSNVFHEMFDELASLLTATGKVEMVDLGSEFQTETANEQIIMQQLGANQTVQTNFEACNYVVFMYLTNVNEVVEDKIVKKSNAVKVDLSARIIDKRTGKCVFVGTGSGVAKAKDFRALGLFKFKTFECPEEQFYEALKAATHELALKIKERI